MLRRKKEFSRYTLDLSAAPVSYVEIGCWAGASAEWVCRKILQHPDIVSITEKWGRPQHHVDYHIFRRNRLVPKPEAATL